MTRDPQTDTPLGRYRPGMPWNPVERVIYERRSVRAFKGKPVPPGLLLRVLEAGRFAPSAGNQQPWRFIVVDDPELNREMEDQIIRFIHRGMWVLDNPNPLLRLLFRPLTRFAQWRKPSEFHPVPFTLFRRIEAGALRVFHDAPALILLLEDRRGVGSPPLDLGICGQQMVLAAQSLGLGSCWIGLVKILMYYPSWRKRLGIAHPYRLTEALALGYMKGRQRGPVPREKQRLTWFGPDGEREILLGAEPAELEGGNRRA